MTITCALCAATREAPETHKGEPRLPRGWKRLAQKIYCPKCKSQQYALRAISIPVAKCDWDSVMPPLREAWRDATRCANWLVSQYYSQDSAILALPGEAPEGKLGKWTTPYLYPAARLRFSSIDPTTLTAIINTVSAKYRALRFDLWRNKASLPTFREIPLAINRQTWKCAKVENSWVFSFRVGGEWRDLFLRRDEQFQRQHRSLAKVISGEMEAGEASLYRAGNSLMLKIAGWFPKEVRTASDRIVKARTCADGFLVAADSGAIWRLNGDHLLRWVLASDGQQQRLREDLKAERRFPKQMRKGIVDRMGQLGEKRKRRLDSWMHEASMQLVNWVKRRKATTLVWDDSYRSMLPSFPWFIFAARLEDKCNLAGLEFVRASEGAALEAESLAPSAPVAT